MFEMDDIMPVKNEHFEMANEHIGIILIVIVGALLAWRFFGARRVISAFNEPDGTYHYH